VFSVRPELAAAGLSAALLLAVAPARGDCARPDVIDSMPIDGARDVPTNAQLVARYAISAEYLGEEVRFGRVDSAPLSLTGSYNADEQLLTLTPPEPLSPGAEYEVEWPGLRGLNTANKGRSRKVRFTAGTQTDVEPPSFDGLTGFDWDYEREDDDCTDRIEERLVFDFDLGSAADDGGRDSLSLVVFQTQGPSVAADAPKPIHVGHFPAPGERVRLVDTVSSSSGHVCYAALARDSTGMPSSGGQERCATVVEPPFFDGCSAAGRPRGGAGAVLAFAAALVASGARGRRRSRS
jgi:hypothetical protein